MKKWFCASISIVLFLVSFPAAPAAGFAVPEKLLYTVSWGGIKAGTASLEITRERNSLRLVSEARSSSLVSVFYTVNDRSEAVLTLAPTPPFLGHPLSYRSTIREGKYRRDREMVFDPARKKAEYRDHLGREKKTAEIRERFFDPLSGLYFLRTMTFPSSGKSVFLPVFDNAKLWKLEVRVLGRERLTTPVGEFDTIVIRPLLKSDGLFARRGDITIWLTDDHKRLPVKMQTKVRLGNVTATLAGGEY